MKKVKNNNKVLKNLKIIILFLAFTVTVSLLYIYNMSDRSKSIIISLRKEKAYLIKDLEKSEMVLNQIMTSNKGLSQKLKNEQIKIKKLVSDLKSKDVTEKTIVYYKNSVANEDERIKILINEIIDYKKKIDSTNLVLDNERAILKTERVNLSNERTNLKVERSKSENLTTENKKLTAKIDNAAKLYLYDLNFTIYHDKGNNKLSETTKAKSANLIKFNFMIAENSLVKSVNKTYYVQIMNSRGNIIGLAKSVNMGALELTYSDKVTVNFKGETLKVEGDIPVSNLIKGDYFLNVFDQSKSVFNTSFSLK